MTNEEPVNSEDIIKIAQKFVPDLEIPQKYTKEQLLSLADKLEAEVKQKSTESLLLRNQIELYYGGINRNYDFTASKKDLDFNSKPGKESVKEYFGRVFDSIKR